MQPLKFILASASPARRQMLTRIGIDPVVQPSQFDESQVQIQDPSALVQVLAESKAKSVAAQQQQPALVLGCDSVLALKGEIYGKPENAEVAIARWQQMRGQTGDLLTGHALIDLYQQQTLVRVQITQVEFAEISDRQIAAYVGTGEPLQCAGCFALDGRGGLFVERIIGCHSNVIGLSLPLLRQMLTDLNYDVTNFWGA
ncbi:MAG: septum formation inhibitor Maf [Aphanocapsa sp. GSE-SYN-MK-11-07L]|jgi:septum formation protein|nr:septum formation inhibitor Maf [Aphanocapsa sp. GSE-SYN-MK-11-07L]